MPSLDERRELLAPGFAVGYEQRDGVVVEVEGGTTTQAAGRTGWSPAPRSPRRRATPLSVEPIAYGPLLLTAPDGRVTHFQRAMARVRTADGRPGLGWIEWNQVRR